MGVVGMAWKLENNLIVDLAALYDVRQEIGESGFNALGRDERYGMLSREIERTAHYKGVIAMPLFSSENPPSVLAMLVVDFTGAFGFDCLKAAVRRPEIAQYAGACAATLDTYRAQVVDDLL